MVSLALTSLIIRYGINPFKTTRWLRFSLSLFLTPAFPRINPSSINYTISIVNRPVKVIIPWKTRYYTWKNSSRMMWNLWIFALPWNSSEYNFRGLPREPHQCPSRHPSKLSLYLPTLLLAWYVAIFQTPHQGSPWLRVVQRHPHPLLWPSLQPIAF